MASMKRIFVSYSSHDREVAQRVCQSLEKAGVRCWIAPRDIAPGANWGGSIAEAIDDAVAMVLVFSRNADNSDQIKKELVLAGDAHKVVIPARVEDLLPIDPSFRYELSSRQWIDLFDDWEAGIARIVERVQQIMPPADPIEARPPSPAPGPAKVAMPAPAAGLGAKHRTGLYAAVAMAVAVLAIGGYFFVANRAVPPVPALPDKKVADTRPPEQKEAPKAPTTAPAPAAPSPETQAFTEALHGCVEAREGGKNADVVVAACSAVLQTGLGTPAERSIALANRGSAYNDRRALDEAMADANRAIDLDPKNAFAYWVRAHVSRNQRQFERAIADFDQYIRLVPKSATAFYWRGNSYLDQGKSERAITDYDEASRIAPDYWPPWQNRCLAYNKLGRYEQALPECTEAIRLNPTWWGNYQTRGETYAGLGKQDLAAKDFDEAKRRNPATPKPPPPAKPAAQPVRVFYNGNVGGVANGGRPPQITLGSPTRITYIMTYHWNNAKGRRPGTIALVSASGVTYGPWQASGQPGQGGVPDAYWIANPNVVLPSGTYQLVDSDPATWAQNGESLGLGMAEIKGVPQ